MIMSFTDFIRKNRSKNETTSKIKTHQIISSWSLSDERTYLGDSPFKTNREIVNLHPLQGTHWVAYNNRKYFASYGCSPLEKKCRFKLRKNGHCFFLKRKNKIWHVKRFSLCRVLFIYNLRDKSLRNRF